MGRAVFAFDRCGCVCDSAFSGVDCEWFQRELVRSVVRVDLIRLRDAGECDRILALVAKSNSERLRVFDRRVACQLGSDLYLSDLTNQCCKVRVKSKGSRCWIVLYWVTCRLLHLGQRSPFSRLVVGLVCDSTTEAS